MAVTKKRKVKIDPVLNHSILSYVYSFLQQNRELTGYEIRDIQVTESGAYRITATNESEDSDIFRVLKILVIQKAGMISDSDFDESFVWEDSEQPTRNTLVQRILVLDEYDEEAAAKQKNSLVPVSLWTINRESGILTALSGKTMDEKLDKALNSESPNVIFNFPVPYVQGMNSVISLSFLTQNFTLRGWHSSLSVLSSAHRYAMSNSPGLKSSEVLEELSSLMKACIRIGVFNEKGERIFLPRSRNRTEKTFPRKYREYMNRTMKKTLYDFSSTL